MRAIRQPAAGTMEALLRRTVGLLVALGVVIALLSVGAAVLVRHSLDERDRVETVSRALGTFLTATVDAETAVRGFLVVQEEEFLDPYRLAEPRLERAARILRTTDREALGPRVEALLALRREWDRVFGRPIIAAVRAGRGEDAVALARTGRGKARIDRIRLLVAATQAREIARLERIDERVRVALAGLIAVLLAGTAFGALALSRTIRLLREGVVQPLAAMRVAAGRMSGGDRDVRVTPAGAAEARELGAAFNAMAADVDRVEQGLRELDELKSTFVSSVSHELRTPLTSIRGYLEMLLDGEEGDLTADQHAAVAIAHRNAQRLDALIGDLLLLASMEAGKLALAREDVHLGDIVEHAHAELRPAADARDIRIERRVDGDPVVCGDERGLAQVVANLLSNAVKFSHVGGTVQVAVARADGEVVTEVADRGVGMPAEDVARLGERFFRARTATGIEGTGLGLSVTREIVERLGGRLEVESAVGEGSTFRVRLPAAG